VQAEATLSFGKVVFENLMTVHNVQNITYVYCNKPSLEIIRISVIWL